MAIQPGPQTSPTKPHRVLQRSSTSSDHPTSPQDDTPSSIYVLSADGSSLFLLDPSKPNGNEEPPPYAPFRITPPEIRSPDDPNADGPGGIESRIETGTPSSPSSSQTPALSPVRTHEYRPRASTFTGIPREQIITIETPPRHLVRNHNSFTYDTESRATRSTRSLRPPNHRNTSVRSSRSSPGIRHNRIPDERQPLLSPSDDWEQVELGIRRGRWRAIFCGEVEDNEETQTWYGGWKRYWRTLGSGVAWRGLLHLTLLNFPFALAVWPFLLVGTLVGTVLLITLPLGAAVWWITLFLTRSAARLEIITQLHHHSPLSSSAPQPTYHPIFYRIKERTRPPSPITPTVDLGTADGLGRESQEYPVEWERRFIKCSYAMFSDHYSYSALVYFLLIKPLLVVFPTIIIIALLPIFTALIFPLPVYLRAVRRWGRWQAGIAVANL